MSALGSVAVRVGMVLADKYRVERVLGVGGMGVVVAARHLELDEVFAIKLMLPTGLDDAPAVERFLREARASARLRGEHVAKVHDVGKLETGAPYMVMEYLSGNDLRKLVKKQGPLPMDDVASYVIDACEAIAEAHALGIIHRDLKPANLFLTRRPNGTACVKVLDFGISKLLDADAGQGLEMTKTSDMLGSPLYMSPEQMRSGKVADARSDIWSLGVVLYELASGSVPFLGTSVTEVCARVLQDQPKPLVSHVPGVSQAFEQIVLRCLEKDPASRYQTADELADALRTLRQRDLVAPVSVVALPSPTESAAGGLSISASWGTTAAPTRAPSSHLHLGLGVGVVLGALCVTGIFLARRGPRPEAPTSPTTAQVSAAAPTVAEPTAPPSASAVATQARPAEAASSAPAASTDRPRPGRLKQSPGPAASTATTKRPPVIDYGDRQ